MVSLATPVHHIVNNPAFAHYGLLGLFLNGMLSSIIPIPTEVSVSALLMAGVSKITLVVVLAIGSIIGGFMSYYLGYGGCKFFERIYYKIKITKPKKQSEDRARILLAKYGWMMIFLSPWLPVYSDVIPVIAGIKGFDFKKFTVAMISGKIVKVIAIVYFLGWILPLIFR